MPQPRRNCLIIAVALAWALPTGFAAAEVARVPWLENPAWSDVLARAAADTGRSILIDFHAPWCGPCRLMEAMVYNETEVVAELADVVTVKIDIDMAANGAVRDTFGVELLPTLVWCDARGREVNRFTGYRNAEEFLEAVRHFRREEGSSRTLAERLAAPPEDPELLLEMAGLRQRRGRDRDAEVAYRRLANLGAGTDPAIHARGLLGLGLGEMRAGRPDAARDLGRRAAATGAVPGEVVAFQEAIGDTAGLLETYRARVATDDMDVVALDGFARTATVLGVELEEASRCALRAVVLSDREPATMATLAESYHRRGLHAKALRWIDEALARDPADTAHLEAKGRYETARAADPWGLKAGRR